MKEELKYPVMMECKKNGLVVEFVDERMGSVRKTTNLCANNYVGEFCSLWYSATDSDVWRVYNPPSLSQPAESISEETAKSLADLMREVLEMPNKSLESALRDYAARMENRPAPVKPAHEKALKTIDILTERIRILSGMLAEYMVNEFLDDNKKEVDAQARINTQYLVDLVNCRTASVVPPIKSDTHNPAKPVYKYQLYDKSLGHSRIVYNIIDTECGCVVFAGSEQEYRDYVVSHEDAT